LDPKRVFDLSPQYDARHLRGRQSPQTRLPAPEAQLMAGRALGEPRFSHDTQQIAYLAPIGACNHATRDCVWERFLKEKRMDSVFLKDLRP
jgi:hypothetical protein